MLNGLTINFGYIEFVLKAFEKILKGSSLVLWLTNAGRDRWSYLFLNSIYYILPLVIFWFFIRQVQDLLIKQQKHTNCFFLCILSNLIYSRQDAGKRNPFAVHPCPQNEIYIYKFDGNLVLFAVIFSVIPTRYLSSCNFLFAQYHLYF